MKTARPVPIESFGERYYMAPSLEYSLFNGAMFNKGEEAGSNLGGEAAGAIQARDSSVLLTSSELSDATRRPQRERQDFYDGTSSGFAEAAPSALLVAAKDSIEARKAAYRLPQSSSVSKGSTAAISSPTNSSVCSTPRHSPDDGPVFGSLRQAQQPGGLVGSSAGSDSSPRRRVANSPDGGVAAAAGAGASDAVEPISAFFSSLNLGKLLSPFTGGENSDDGAAAAAASVLATAPQPQPAQQRVHSRPREGPGYAVPVPENTLPQQRLFGDGGVGGSSLESSRTPSPPAMSSGVVGAPPGFGSSSSSGSRARMQQASTGMGPGPPQQAQRHGYGAAAACGGSLITPRPSRTPSPHPSAAAAAMSRPVLEEREQALAQEADVLAAWVEDMVAKSGGVAAVSRLDAALSLSNSRAYQVLCVRYTGLREFLSRNPSRFVFGVAEPSRELVVVLSTAVGGISGEGITYTLPSRHAAAVAVAGHRKNGGSASSADVDPSCPRSAKNTAPVVAAVLSNAVNGKGRSAGSNVRHDRTGSESASERSASSAASKSGGGHRDDLARLNDSNGYHSGGGGSGSSSSSSLAISGVGGINNASILSSSNWLEEKVAMESAEILKDAATRSLKAVELANTLRARLGTEVLALVREQHGGLLSLLERHPNLFRVDRIPKSDCVTLICSMPLSSRSGGNSGGSNSGGGSGIPTPLESPRERLGGGGGGGSSGYRSGPEDGPVPLSEGAGLGHGQVATQGATRCLHIGNVPLVMSEDELKRCFDRYGRVEGLRVVNQRGHRFAFVNYVSVEEAVHAKACLSRQNVWRSAVSFARRESPRPPCCESFESFGSGGYASDHSVGSSDGRASLATAAAAAGPGQGGHYRVAAGWPAVAASSSAYWPAGNGVDAAQLASQEEQQQLEQPSPIVYARPPYQQQQQQLQHPFIPQQQPQQLPQLSLFGSSLASPPSDQTHGSASQQQQQQQQQQQLMAEASSSAAASALAAVGTHRTGSLGGNGGTMSEFPAESPVMTTLTSDQFVPTQAWPANFAQDWPYVEAVVEQLRQVGGSTTVSKLRGLLKNRLGSVRTVKSVPLKALLQAYAPLFVLHGNRVSLMSAAAGIGGGSGGGMQQLSMGGHGPPPGMRLGMGMG